MTAHTPGPWLMASKPSLGGGWPVVSPSADGRHVCRITYVQHSPIDPKVPGDDAFNRESRANGLLIQSAPNLLAALRHVVVTMELEHSRTCPARICDCDLDDTRDHALRSARAVIAKAESQ